MVALAVDLGASGGKAVAGAFDGERLEVREVCRFANDPVAVGGRLHWDVLRLLHETKLAIRRADREVGPPETVGVDAWGLDFGLLDRRGELLGNPRHYRDPHTAGAMEAVWEVVPREEIYARTGIQFMPFNTLYQLAALLRDGSTPLEQAATLLMIPDLLRHFLGGEPVCEYTDATTTQCLARASGDWDRELLGRLGLPTALLPPVVPPFGPPVPLAAAVRAELGVGPVSVVTVAGHDTASAVLAVPAAEADFAYLSCGTWSLCGTEVDRPVVDGRSLAWNFTNEGGAGGRNRLLRNIAGLWLAEECRRAWAAAGLDAGYDRLLEGAARARPFAAVVDPDDPRFFAPGDMPARIGAFCVETGQTAPDDPAAVLRCVLESLALKTRLVLERTEALADRRFPGLHVVGGGCRNGLLMQLTADAIGRPVWAGPAEATAVGNLLGQLIAVGRIAGVAEARAVVRASLPVETYKPDERDAWDDAYGRFRGLLRE
jgi:rhamnulokinase